MIAANQAVNAVRGLSRGVGRAWKATRRAGFGAARRSYERAQRGGAGLGEAVFGARVRAGAFGKGARMGFRRANMSRRQIQRAQGRGRLYTPISPEGKLGFGIGFAGGGALRAGRFATATGTSAAYGIGKYAVQNPMGAAKLAGIGAGVYFGAGPLARGAGAIWGAGRWTPGGEEY